MSIIIVNINHWSIVLLIIVIRVLQNPIDQWFILSNTIWLPCMNPLINIYIENTNLLI